MRPTVPLTILPTLHATVEGSRVRFTTTPMGRPEPGRLTRFGPSPKPIADRLTSAIEVALNGCWIWKAKVAAADGYGRMTVGSKANGGLRNVVAHRVVYTCMIGPVPDGLDLDHVCHNADTGCPGGATCVHRRCVNPAHLRPASRGENLRAGRGIAAERSSQTHCIHGHEFTEANTIRRGERGRICRACANERRKAFPHYRKDPTVEM